MLKKIFFLLTAVILANCTNNSRYIFLPVKQSEINGNFTIKKINIPLDSVGMIYYRKVSVLQKDTVYYLLGYHRILHALDLYNISARKFLKRILLSKRGPDNINDVESIYFKSIDSIFINTINSLVLLDRNGVIKKRIKLSDNENFKKNKVPNGTIRTNLSFGLSYLNLDSAFLFFYFPYESKNYSHKYLKLPFAIELKLKDQELNFLPLNYSGYYFRSKYGYGNMYIPNLTVFNNLIIYNFPIEPNIYTYDLLTGKFNRYGARSKYAKNLSEPYKKGEDPNLYLVKNTIFFKTIYDPFRKVYYRIHWGNCELKKNSKEFNTLFDKKLFLMVFDSSFRVIREIKLNEYRYLPFGYFVTNEGLFISTSHPMNKGSNPELLSYDLFIFSENSK